MKKFDVAGFLPVTLLDFPGRVATTVFTYGCNLRCRYCHNPELVIGVEPDSHKEQFMKYIFDNNIEAVAITGGEPLMLPDIELFLHELKSNNIHVKLDTNGTFPSRLESVFKESLVDYLAVDIKGFCDEDYSFITRTDARINNFVRTIKLAKSYEVPFEVRYTAWKIPSAEDVAALYEMIGDIKIIVQQLNTESKMLDKRYGKGFKKVDTGELYEVLSTVFSDVHIREAAYA